MRILITTISLLTFCTVTQPIIAQQLTGLTNPPLANAPSTNPPATKRSFKEQAAAAMAKLRPGTATDKGSSSTTGTAKASINEGVRPGEDPLLQLNAAYYTQAQRLAKIVPKLPAELRSTVERDIESLNKKRKQLIQLRQHAMAQRAIVNPEFSNATPAQRFATRQLPSRQLPNRQLPNRQSPTTAERLQSNQANQSRSNSVLIAPSAELGSAYGASGQRANASTRIPAARLKPTAIENPVTSATRSTTPKNLSTANKARPIRR